MFGQVYRTSDKKYSYKASFENYCFCSTQIAIHLVKQNLYGKRYFIKNVSATNLRSEKSRPIMIT